MPLPVPVFNTLSVSVDLDPIKQSGIRGEGILKIN